MPVESTIIKQDQTQADAILEFYQKLQPAFNLPEGVIIMNPFHNSTSWGMTESFYKKFYNDKRQRIFIFGINPGRFGGGVTGIPFTDPIRLESDCGIKNECKKISELSSIFIYEVVKGYGGVDKFFGDFFITALSPLGFTRSGVNLNYYDDKELLKNSETFIVQCIQQQQRTIHSSANCFCLGEGVNFKIFNKLNDHYHFFKEIFPLPHPRWIMQYRRKKLNEYIELYVEALKRIVA